MVEIMAKETEKKKAEGAYFITTKELAEAGRDNIPEELISSKHLIYSSPATLAYNSPGAQGFGVKRAGLAIPGSVMLLLAPGCCGRNTTILSELGGYSERFFYLMMDETDIVTGRHLKKVPQAVEEIYDCLETKPSVVMICLTCVDALLGTDMERICKRAQKAVGIPVLPCYMYALTREGRKPPMVHVRQSIYSLLEPKKKKSTSVNLLGHFAPLEDDSELYDLLRQLGIKKIREISRCKNYDEYLDMAEANFNLVLDAEARFAAADMRGNDVESTPVILSYLLLGEKKLTWYVQAKCLSEKIKILLDMQGIKAAPYAQIYEDIKKLPEDASIYYDKSAVNTALVSSLPEKVKKIEGVNPTFLFKAKKNPVEVENERNAHIKDGVAVTKFIYWLKSQIGKTKITEISAAEQLEQFRNTQEHYVEPSFAPIIAYKEHGAIVHYSATKESDVELKPESFVLADTGGHYLEGTTDITRTIALGSLTQEEKEMYTMVLKGHIQLEMARFLQGCSGQSLDVLARTPLWEKGLDYNHGTGHGVGYLLSVHEGPNSFRYRPSVNGRNDCVFEEGMITSDEPGIYLEGKFGIRLENMIVCQKDMENDYGSFLCFDALTLVPFERSAIIAEELSTKEKEWLNKYHQKVFETIAPYLTEEEAGWLREETQEF